jgi:hypothetical protein
MFGCDKTCVTTSYIRGCSLQCCFWNMIILSSLKFCNDPNLSSQYFFLQHLSEVETIYGFENWKLGCSIYLQFLLLVFLVLLFDKKNYLLALTFISLLDRRCILNLFIIYEISNLFSRKKKINSMHGLIIYKLKKHILII